MGRTVVVRCSPVACGTRDTRRAALVALIASPTPWLSRNSNASSNRSWNYQDSWVGTCREGRTQSPILLDDKKLVDSEERVLLNIDDVPEKIWNATVTNNSHGSPQIDFPEDSCSVVFERERFNLIQIHFHSPSEHLTNDTIFPMETHLVLRSHKNPERLLVIAILCQIGDKRNTLLEESLDKVPSVGDKGVAMDPIALRSLMTASDSRKGRDSSQFYYWYTGSLTTPPCSEPVDWLVQDPAFKTESITTDQLDRFLSLSAIPGNARGIQNMNGRTVRKVYIK